MEEEVPQHRLRTDAKNEIAQFPAGNLLVILDSRLRRDRPILNPCMDLSCCCGAAPAGISSDEDLFGWVSWGEKKKRRPVFPRIRSRIERNSPLAGSKVAVSSFSFSLKRDLSKALAHLDQSWN